MQKTVNVEAKAGLRFSTMIQDSDIYCPKGYCFSNSIASKVLTQGTTAKDSHPEELKVKEIRPISSWTKASKPSEQDRKERKKKRSQERQDKEQTSASTANVSEIQQKKKKKNWDWDISKITCFNYNKKGYYTNTYTEPPKN